jgi:hypothetical protein
MGIAEAGDARLGGFFAVFVGVSMRVGVGCAVRSRPSLASLGGFAFGLCATGLCCLSAPKNGSDADHSASKELSSHDSVLCAQRRTCARRARLERW